MKKRTTGVVPAMADRRRSSTLIWSMKEARAFIKVSATRRISGEASSSSQMMHRRPVIVAGRLEPDPNW